MAAIAAVQYSIVLPELYYTMAVLLELQVGIDVTLLCTLCAMIIIDKNPMLVHVWTHTLTYPHFHTPTHTRTHTHTHAHTFSYQKMPEEQAFSVLVKIMYNYGHREVFMNNFQNLHLMFFQLCQLLEVIP